MFGAIVFAVLVCVVVVVALYLVWDQHKSDLLAVESERALAAESVEYWRSAAVKAEAQRAALQSERDSLAEDKRYLQGDKAHLEQENERLKAEWDRTLSILESTEQELFTAWADKRDALAALERAVEQHKVALDDNSEQFDKMLADHAAERSHYIRVATEFMNDAKRLRGEAV